MIFLSANINDFSRFSINVVKINLEILHPVAKPTTIAKAQITK